MSMAVGIVQPAKVQAMGVQLGKLPFRLPSLHRFDVKLPVYPSPHPTVQVSLCTRLLQLCVNSLLP